MAEDEGIWIELIEKSNYFLARVSDKRYSVEAKAMNAQAALTRAQEMFNLSLLTIPQPAFNGRRPDAGDEDD